MTPLLSVGGPQFPLGTAGAADFEAINNEEFYFRPHETPVFTLDDDQFDMSGSGDLFDPLFVDPDTGMIVGMILDDGAAGIRIPGNGSNFAVDAMGNPIPPGQDIFGNPIPIGQATLNLELGGNGFFLGTDIQDFSFDPVLGMPAGLTQFGPGGLSAVFTAEQMNFFNRGF